MLIEQSGISFGEDVLSTYYSAPSDTSSSTPPTSSYSFLTTSSSSGRRHTGGVLSFLRLRNWFGFGTKERQLAIESFEKNDDVEEIMECFRRENVAGMNKFMETSRGSEVKEEEEEEYWWDDELKNGGMEAFEEESIPPRQQKDTPHPKKTSKMRKSVRFDLKNTPADKRSRPFTPLFTSTPNTFDGELSSDDEEPITLRNCDSNTVAAPRATLNNTSSILLSNTSIMGSLCKTRHQTDDALLLALDTERAKDYYKMCFDDEDMEEKCETTPTQKTFVIEKKTQESCSDSDSDEKMKSFENGEKLGNDVIDTSTDSSVVLELDRIEDYIRNLDGEISEARRFATEGDVARARGALQTAQCLQERIGQMSEAISEMCGKFTGENRAAGETVFEDSCWAAQLDFESGSFDAQELRL